MTEQIPENQVDLPQAPVAVSEKKSKTLLIAILLIAILLIGVGGVYTGMQIGKKQVGVWVEPPFTVATPQPTEITPVSNETTNWKTYTTGTFFIKYPNSWNEPKSFLQSTRWEYVFESSSLNIVVGSYYDQSLGRNRTYEEEISLGGLNAKSKTDIKVAGLSAVKYLYATPKSTINVIFSSKEGLIYWISMDVLSSQDALLFDQILSTFRFLE